MRIVTGVPHDKVPEYLNAMDLLVAPSQTTPWWKEQFGRMLIEAMACGVPVIGSDSGEIPYVIGDAGMVVSDVDVAGWARAIATLVESPDRRAWLVPPVSSELIAPLPGRSLQQHLTFLSTLFDYETRLLSHETLPSFG